jgi:ubiquinone/menaquinone biosynthesis C-methylase UbiE
MSQPTPIRFDASGFTDVDQTQDPELFIRYLDRANQIPVRAESTRLAIELLELREGDHAADIGCGGGEGLRELARVVGPSGRAIGVDSSGAMIAAAKERLAGTGGPIDLVEASVYALPFAQGSLAGCTAGRLLQHLDRPREALREMIRVTKSGGRISITDVDWGTSTLDSSDPRLSDKVLEQIWGHIRSPRVGRQLHAMFKEVGLVDVRITARPIVQYDLATTRQLFWFDFRGLTQAVADGVLSEREVRSWIADLEERDRTGRFFAMMVGFMAVGRVP